MIPSDEADGREGGVGGRLAGRPKSLPAFDLPLSGRAARCGAVLGAALSLMAGCAVELQNVQPAQEMAQAAQPPGSVYTGWRVFQDRCATCHGGDAAGDKAPNLLPRVREMGSICFAVAFDPDGWKRVALELVQQAGIELRLHSWFSRTLVEDGRVSGVVCESKSGPQAILGQVVIDATGDLDVAVSAGAAHTGGNYNMTTVFRLGGVDCAAAERFEGTFYRGEGDVEYLQLLDISRRMFGPDPEYQNLSMLYEAKWNGLVEGPTWDAWWIQNSYGTTYAALPFLREPFVTFLQN